MNLKYYIIYLILMVYLGFFISFLTYIWPYLN